MRIVFMGTPDFAAVCLKALLDENYDVVGAFTQPDKPKGRGHKLAVCPVKELAAAHDIPVFQPETLRDGTALADLTALAPDLIVVVAYGRILPDDILALPPLGCINIHGSVLPKYRGSAPIQWSVINGDKTAGVTSMYMATEMDAGDIIFTAETPIGEKETSSALFERLAPMGASLLLRTIRAIEDGTAPRTPQDSTLVTFAPMLSKELSPIDWNREPRAILKQIYGLQDWPCATAVLGGTEFKIYDADLTEHTTDKAPGTLVSAGKQGIEVACAGGRTLMLRELQASGGKRMSAAAYLLGHPMEV